MFDLAVSDYNYLRSDLRVILLQKQESLNQTLDSNLSKC